MDLDADTEILSGEGVLAGRRVLVVTSVPAERDAVLRGLNGNGRFHVIAGGVGPASAAASTATALAEASYGLVLCMGIAGGFPGRAEVGSLVVSSEIIAADLGAETPEGFNSLDELGFGSARIGVDADLAATVTAALQAPGCRCIGAGAHVINGNGNGGDCIRACCARVPGAAAEAMEGYGAATAAVQRGIPVLEIRAVSNAVGPRDRAAWRIPDALKALEAASSVLTEVL